MLPCKGEASVVCLSGKCTPISRITYKDEREESMIQVEGLTKYYGSYKAIDSLSFHADAGEIVGFLGPNGAGKTTTMRILTGYMPPSEGRASIAGFDVLEQSLEARQHIGYLPETVPLYKELTVRQYVDYMAGLRGMSSNGRRSRVDEVIEMVGMSDRANSMVANLSKGMRQRVGLAQALVHSPKVLILDEPTIGLDPRQVLEVRNLIRDVGQERTVLLSTHILSEVSQLCSRILIINKGQIVAEDRPDTLSSRIQGSVRFHVQVGKAKPAEVAKALKALKGVTAADAGENGVDVTAEAKNDVRPLVAETIVKKGWQLLELRPLGMSLEDIFMELTTDDSVGEEE
jgi:ABC-2 type transport system ATP-binding protein